MPQLRKPESNQGNKTINPPVNLRFMKAPINISPPGVARRTAFLLALGLGGLVMRGFAGVDDQVDALLSKMTLDEKVGQMAQVNVNALQRRSNIQKYFLGSILNGGGGGPTNNVPENGLSLSMHTSHGL